MGQVQGPEHDRQVAVIESFLGLCIQFGTVVRGQDNVVLPLCRR